MGISVPTTIECVKDGKPPKKLCADPTDKRGCRLYSARHGGKTCLMRIDCGSIGLGFYLGCGGTIPLGIAMNDIEESLAGYSVGIGSDIGFCWASYGFGGSLGIGDNGITSIGSSKGIGHAGMGCGFSLTIDFCETTVQWCKILPP